jgi:7-cyano-7-deazaguanine synthase
MAGVLILLSGGIDSAACVAYAQPIASTVEALFIDYLQPARHSERESAVRIARHYGIQLQIAEATAAPAASGEIMGRNGFLIFCALMSKPSVAGLLMMGIHCGTPYYDCSPTFVGDMQRVLDGYSGGKTQLSTPFLSWSKQDILHFCKEKDVPLHLTWSCESNSYTTCWHCLSCRDKAMADVGTAH